MRGLSMMAVASLALAIGCTRDDGRSGPAEPSAKNEPTAGRPGPVAKTPATVDAGAPSAPVADAATGAATQSCRVAATVTRALNSNSDDVERAALKKALATLAKPADAEAAASPITTKVIAALKARDYKALSKLAGSKGVCLSPSKGGACVQMSRAALAGCARGRKRFDWDVDTGADDVPRRNCSQAMETIFLAHPRLLDATPHYNCFPPRADNNAVPILADYKPGAIYVELHADELEPVIDPKTHKRVRDWHGWLSLWIVLVPNTSGKLELDRLISHYWGI